MHGDAWFASGVKHSPDACFGSAEGRCPSWGRHALPYACYLAMCMMRACARTWDAPLFFSRYSFIRKLPVAPARCSFTKSIGLMYIWIVWLTPGGRASK